MEHTKEPWNACCTENEKTGSHYVFDESGEIAICQMLSNPKESEKYDDMCPVVSVATKNANARRIVACVNCCEGIPTDELEISTFLEEELKLRREKDIELLNITADRDKWKAMAEELGEALEEADKADSWTKVMIIIKEALTRLKEAQNE